MNLIQKIKRVFTNSPESNLTQPQQWLLEALGVGNGITADTALEVTACYACVRIIAEQIAILPLNIYLEAGQGREKQKQHPLHRLLNIQPNPYMTAYNFWRAMMFNLELTGYAYAEIERDRRTAQPKALWPIPTKYVQKRRNAQGEPVYQVTLRDGNVNRLETIHDGDMLEIDGLTPDGVVAYDPVKLLKKALKLSRSAEDFSNEYFENGAHPSGIITYPGNLQGQRREAFKTEVRSGYTGMGKRSRVMLLEDGMTFTRIAAPPNEGQMFESRKFQVIEIARFFNIPPHKIMEMDRATYNNIEEMNIQFVNDSLLPRLINIRQAVYQSLLFEFEKAGGYYVEYDLNNLLRGRLQDRFAAYAQARQWGWMNVNEIRAKENMSNIGTQGDTYLEPVNMRQAGDESEGAEKR